MQAIDTRALSSVREYLTWLAQRDGIGIPDGAAFQDDGLYDGHGKGAKLLLAMPGHGASQVVTLETLDDSGAVIRSQSVTDVKRGGISLKADQVLAATGLAKGRKVRATVSPFALDPRKALAMTADEMRDYCARAGRGGSGPVAVDAVAPAPTDTSAAKVARAAGHDAGNRFMREAGREAWDADDWNAAAETCATVAAAIAPVSAAPDSPASISTPTDAVANIDATDTAALLARIAKLESVVDDLIVIALRDETPPVVEKVEVAAPPSMANAPAEPSDDIGQLPAKRERTPTERKAIIRAWRMRGEMRARADLDRRALDAANGAYRGALDALQASNAERDAARAKVETLEFDLIDAKGRAGRLLGEVEAVEARMQGAIDTAHGAKVKAERDAATWERRALSAGWKAPRFNLAGLMTGNASAAA